uniref:Integrase catalytic domain-containing protein n=1 Tax=Heterorhabditis bacteriophora TaxID=37862 RepID=A0A1I7W6P8_HETBA
MDKTKEVIKRRFYWTRLDDDVREFVRNCAQCQRRKSDPHQATKEPIAFSICDVAECCLIKFQMRTQDRFIVIYFINEQDIEIQLQIKSYYNLSYMVIYYPLTVHFYSFLYLPYAPPLRLSCSLTYSRLSKSIYRNKPMGTLEDVNMPCERWHIDILGPLPRTEKGNRYILSMKDAFSKWIVTSEKYLTEGCLKLGTPRVVVTDNGTNFKSGTFTEALKLMGIEHQVTSPYHKNSNGQVERLHRTLEECLSAYVNNTQSDWDNYLPFITFAINTMPN